MNTDSLLLFFNTYQSRLRFALAILFGALCVLFLILTLKTLLFPGPVAYAEISFANQPRTSVRWNWFTSPSAPVTEEKEEEELAIATINAELLGVVIAGEDSVATLTVSRADAQVFRIGDEIQRNVSLEEVESNRVVISQSGVRRQILLKDITGNASRTSEEDSLIRVNDAPSNAGVGFSLPGVGSTTPIQVSGEGMGLRLSDVSSDIADLADLQDGDVVLGINGTPVSELFSNPLLWQQFSQETNLPMTVLRGDVREEVYVNAASLFQKIIPQLGAGMIQ